MIYKILRMREAEWVGFFLKGVCRINLVARLFLNFTNIIIQKEFIIYAAQKNKGELKKRNSEYSIKLNLWVVDLLS